MKALSFAAIAVALAAGATPAEAGWRDYMGKTVVAVMDYVDHSTTRNVGDTGAPSRWTTMCTQNYHAYVSSRGRLFLHAPVIECDGGEPFRVAEPSGLVVDLTVPEGTLETAYFNGSYTVKETDSGVEIKMPNEDKIIEGDDGRGVFTQSTGSTTIVVDFEPQCSIRWLAETSSRHDYRSKSSDYHTFTENTSQSTGTTISCEIVEGFR